MFKMAKSDNTWKIVGEDPLPDWIFKNESIFNELIEEELKING